MLARKAFKEASSRRLGGLKSRRITSRVMINFTFKFKIKIKFKVNTR